MAISNLIFPYDRAADVLHGVGQWLVDAAAVGGGAYLVQADAAPGTVPALNVFLASRGTPAELASEAARLLSLTGAVTARQDAVMTYQQVMMMIFGCSTLDQDQCQRAGKSPSGVLTRPAFGLERTRLGSAPSPSDWANVVTAFDADRKAGQARYLDFHFFGGAANDPARTDTAYVHRDSLSVNYRVLINDPGPGHRRASGRRHQLGGPRVRHHRSAVQRRDVPELDGRGAAELAAVVLRRELRAAEGREGEVRPVATQVRPRASEPDAS